MWDQSKDNSMTNQKEASHTMMERKSEISSIHNIILEQKFSGKIRSNQKADVGEESEVLSTVEESSSNATSDIISDINPSKPAANRFESSCNIIYKSACRMFNEVPVSYFIRHQDSDVMRMRHHSVGPMGMKAICVALLSNATIETLNFDDNGIGSQGAVYASDMLRENFFITDLTLSNNDIGTRGATALFHMIQHNDSLIRLDLSGNPIGDRIGYEICEALIENTRLTDINLCSTSLGEKTGCELGRMLAADTALLKLDVCFNNLRTKGIQTFLQGLKKNKTLLTLKLASNGIGLEGCAELGKAIQGNSTLEELDVANNRIPLAGTLLLAKGLKNNSTLQYLNLSRNPFMAPGCMIILEMLGKAPNTGLRFLSFETTLVTKQFADMQKDIEAQRFILIQHGGVMEEWRYDLDKAPANTREALSFLTDEEFKQLAEELDKHNRRRGKEASIKTFTRAINECGWNNRCVEMIQRLRRVVTQGKIEYESLLQASQTG